MSAALVGLLGVPLSACGGEDAQADEPAITSSRVVPGLTLEAFTAQCDERHGTVEIIPHCGGVNTCRGMSYDTETEVLTEHTCKGLNTCGGFSCVVPG